MRLSARVQQRNAPPPTGERRREDARQIAEALAKRGRIALRVHGTSMLPWVRPGDIALIHKAGPGSVRFGDVALLHHGERILVHRIVQKQGSFEREAFLSKGDALSNPDAKCREAQLLGRVVRVLRNGKRIDLEAPGQLALALLIAKLSPVSRFWYPVPRLLAYTTRPMRRQLVLFR